MKQLVLCFKMSNSGCAVVLHAVWNMALQISTSKVDLNILGGIALCLTIKLFGIRVKYLVRHSEIKADAPLNCYFLYFLDLSPSIYSESKR